MSKRGVFCWHCWYFLFFNSILRISKSLITFCKAKLFLVTLSLSYTTIRWSADTLMKIHTNTNTLNLYWYLHLVLVSVSGISNWYLVTVSGIWYPYLVMVSGIGIGFGISIWYLWISVSGINIWYQYLVSGNGICYLVSVSLSCIGIW